MPWGEKGCVSVDSIPTENSRPLTVAGGKSKDAHPSSITKPSWWWPLDKAPMIWIVEDDVSTQRIVVEHLKAKGFMTAVFDSAEKAHAGLQTQTQPSLII